MEANNNDDNDDNNQNQQQAAADVFAGAGAAPAARRGEKRLKLNSILTRNDQFQLRQRTKIDELVDIFLDNLEDDVHDMIFDQNVSLDYQGLDSERDTEAEVETALRFFPEVLSRRKEVA